MTAVLWCGWGLAIGPQLDGESSSRDLMREARDLAGPGTEVGLVAWREQNLLQARGPTVEFGFTRTPVQQRSEEHTSELQSLMRISYAVFCLKKKKKKRQTYYHHHSRGMSTM